MQLCSPSGAPCLALFFFQAEDGIRDLIVTGVQTCALPIFSAYAGDARGAIAELNRLVAQVDGMGIPDPVTVKVNALSNVAVIAIDKRDFPAAAAALKQRTPLVMQQADQVGSAGFRRAQEQGVAYFNAWLAAREGDYRTAQRETNRLTALVTPDANPRKMEPVHQLKGFIALCP